MIRLEQPSAPRPAPLAAVPLPTMLRRQRKRWLDAYQRCRRKLSKKAVHDLRVQSRRLLAVLGLARIVLPHREVDPIVRALRSRIKRFGRLRDVQIQRGLVKSLAPRRKDVQPMARFLKQREARQTRRLAKELEEGGTRKLHRELTRLEKALEHAGKDSSRSRRQAHRILAAVEAAFRQVKSRRHRVRADQPATLHQTRMAFKRFRYMVEALQKVLPGATRERIRAMQAFQTRLGEIQDVEVLLQRVEKYVARHAAEAERLEAFQVRAAQRLTELIRRQVTSMDELDQFWPLPSATIQLPGNHRRRTVARSARRILKAHPLPG
ncbi:MAG TPA: hypothetical protein DCY13_08315 [Verrucomicrobiales bacterium]|nr:hypothetical protein [Verrucomicrobiales bacterium]